MTRRWRAIFWRRNEHGTTYERQYEQYRLAVEETSERPVYRQRTPYGRLYESMRYSLLSGGKRLRPVMTLEFARLGGIDWHLALPYACARWSWYTPTP